MAVADDAANDAAVVRIIVAGVEKRGAKVAKNAMRLFSFILMFRRNLFL